MSLNVIVAMKKDSKVKTDLTHEKLKTYKGFENTTEAEAKQQIGIIKRLAKILFFMYMDEQKQKNSKRELL